MPKPSIAAINGAAAGAGLSFALACDLRVHGRGAVLMMAFSNIGLVPDSGGSWFLARAVGYARALELAITRPPGRTPTRRSSLGLVAAASLPRDELRPPSPRSPPSLAARPTQALGWTKRLMREALSRHARRDVIELEAQLQAAAVRSTTTPRASPRSSRSASRASRAAERGGAAPAPPDRQPGRHAASRRARSRTRCAPCGSALRRRAESATRAPRARDRARPTTRSRRGFDALGHPWPATAPPTRC